MNAKRFLSVVVLLWLAAALPGGALAQQPVVYAALFYSPSCGHCHYVITESLPPLQEEFGAQLQVLYIDVSQPGGGELFQTACYTLAPNNDYCGYVPTLIIGETVLVGSGEIPEKLPGLVRSGIAAGGIGLPPIPGLREAYEAAIGIQGAGDSAGDAADPASAGEGAEAAAGAADVPAVIPSVSTAYVETTWRDRLRQDPVGNGLAVGILGVLVVGLAAQVSYGARLAADAPPVTGRAGSLPVVGLALLATAVAATLALQNGSLSLPTALAAGVTLGLAAAVVGIARGAGAAGQRPSPGWVFPLVALLGLGVAAYLAFVEVGDKEAVCGAVGDCNTVQQSPYAKVFGVLPIGVLGVAGYVAILGAWLVSQSTAGRLAALARAGLLGLALFGTAFSIYLTFLEPFVIGATCAWCLTSALLMALLLYLHAPAGWAALHGLLAGRRAR